MATDEFKNLLELSKMADEMTQKKPQQTVRTQRNNSTILTRDNFEQKIAELDEAVYGKYVETEADKAKYDPKAEMERIKERKLPEGVNVTNPILMEVMNNPYDMNVDEYETLCDPKMNILEQKLMSKINKTDALASAKEITKALDEKDKLTLQESRTVGTQSNGAIDYSMIKMIIEKVIDEKLEKLSNKILTESRNGLNSSNTSMIMLGENFTFVDTQGNMYKCGDMKYVGKAKMKKK